MTGLKIKSSGMKFAEIEMSAFLFPRPFTFLRVADHLIEMITVRAA